MTEQKIKMLEIQLKLISEYLLNIGIVLDDLKHDDITMTDEHKEEMIMGMYGDSYKLGLAVKKLQKELSSEIPKEWREVLAE